MQRPEADPPPAAAVDFIKLTNSLASQGFHEPAG